MTPPCSIFFSHTKFLKEEKSISIFIRSKKIKMFSDLFVEEDEQPPEATATGSGAAARKALAKPPEERASCGFMGLKVIYLTYYMQSLNFIFLAQNQGATCYLNSLLQVLYMTPELREGLYQLDPYELGYEDGNQADNSLATAAQGTEPDENLLNQLLSMSLNEAGVVKSLLATKNSSFDAALEYYFQHEQDDGFLVTLGTCVLTH